MTHQTLQVRIRIEPRAAILARKTVAGIVAVDITEENLKELTDEELAELADLVEKSAVLESPVLDAPTFEVVKRWLEQSVAAKKKFLESQEAAAAEMRAIEARAAEQEVVRKRESRERDAANAKAISAWIEEHADEDAKERHKAGFLAEQEIIDEVMHQLFEINEDEHVPIRKEQACDCERGCAGSVRFQVVPVIPNVNTLDSSQFSTLQRVQESAPEGATVQARLHQASCPECKCTPLARFTAHVSMQWNGWLLVKEYALG